MILGSFILMALVLVALILAFSTNHGVIHFDTLRLYDEPMRAGRTDWLFSRFAQNCNN